jgi:hypothetical protein
MSITLFLAFCILGCDFLLYALYQWIYGEKYRNRSRRSAAHRQGRPIPSAKQVKEPRVLPFPQRAMHS